MTKQKTARLKICVGYHKPSFLLQGDCFVPVWGGRAVAEKCSKDGNGLSAAEQEWMNANCVGDDTGDNISDKNREYCEASILYWMWKNYDKLGNPDYIGFLQYRRHWILNDCLLELHKPDFYNMVQNEFFFEDYQYEIGLTEHAIIQELSDCDGIFCTNDTGRTIEDYKSNHHSQDVKYWHKALEIIEKDWPQYAPAAKIYNNGTWHAWSNCFVMKREDFLEYCPFLFDVLKKIDKFAESEYKNMTAEQMRVPAYVSETMLGIFWIYKQNQGRVFKSRPLMYITKPFTSPCLLPQHIAPINKNAIPVVFIADDNYVKYTAVAIESLIQNSSKSNNYDIIILHDGRISTGTQKRLESMHQKNISIRFFNARYYIYHYNFAEFWHRRLNLMPYLKLFIHEILQDYDKAIFLDGDMLVLQDVALLYRQSLNCKLMGVVNDCIMTQVKTDFWKNRRSYVVANNKMQDVANYFNSGMLLLDLQQMRKKPELLNMFINEARFKHENRLHHDQDVFNFVLENDVKQLSPIYNYQSYIFKPIHWNNISVATQEKMLAAFQDNVVIMHYDGDSKPWQINSPKDLLTDLWWKYARQTPFYEQFLIAQPKQTNVIYNYPKSKYWRKYQVHRFLSWITFGKMHKKQKHSAHHYKTLLKIR